MQELILVILTVLLALVLTACGAAPGTPQTLSFPALATTAQLASPSASTIAPSDPRVRPLSDAARLVIGSFKLEGTDQAITADEAARLLPLWEQVKDVEGKPVPAGQPQANATPRAPGERAAQVEALVKQIQAAMTPAQLDAISKMQLTQQDMRSMLQAQGILMMRPSGNGTFTPPQGNPPAGGVQAPNATPGPNGWHRPDAIGTPGPGFGPLGGAMPPGLVEAFIRFLQRRAGS